MSEPDAVPLPREGEVFFDVRGDARTMRLSWYADSRVAVFSIWQGNRCTGTFRLPFADLERMVRVLQAGPRPRDVPPTGTRYPTTWPGYADDPGREYSTGNRDYRPARYADPEPIGLRQAAPAHVARVETRWPAASELGQHSAPEGRDRPSDTDLLGYPSVPGRHRPSARP
jgi:hypothetical protein